MKNNNLESFVNVLIRMVEASENHNKEQLDAMKQNIKEQKKTINSLKTQITEIRVNTAVSNATSLFKGNLRAKLVIAIIALLTTISALIIKFNAELFNYITECFK